MAQVLTPTLRFSIAGTHRNAEELEEANVVLNFVKQTMYAHGTTDGKVDLVFSDEHVLTAGASKEYDLTALVDAVFGTPLNFAWVKAVVIVSALEANKVLTFGAAVSNPWVALYGDASDTEKINPGCTKALWGPKSGAGYAYPVTSESKILKIANASGGSSTFQIWIFGTSA